MEEVCAFFEAKGKDMFFFKRTTVRRQLLNGFETRSSQCFFSDQPGLSNHNTESPKWLKTAPCDFCLNIYRVNSAGN